MPKTRLTSLICTVISIQNWFVTDTHTQAHIANTVLANHRVSINYYITY